MANLRADLLNEIRNQKYYAEIELIRLAQDGTMNYREKIDSISDILSEIAIINQKMILIDSYFTQPEVTPTPEAKPAPAPQQQAVPHAGQSHGE